MEFVDRMLIFVDNSIDIMRLTKKQIETIVRIAREFMAGMLKCICSVRGRMILNEVAILIY